MIHPTFDEFKKIARKNAVISLYREYLADMETPLSVYARVCDAPYSFLLESVEGGENVARYSFIGCDARAVFKARRNEVTFITPEEETTFVPEDSPIEELRRRMGEYTATHNHVLPRFNGGAVGYIGYDTVRYFEDIPDTTDDDLNVPDIYLVFTKTLIAFDHARHRIIVIANVHCDGRDIKEIYDDGVKAIDECVARITSPLETQQVVTLDAEALADRSQPPPASNFTEKEFASAVEKCKEYVRAGDIIQVVPSQRFACPTHASPLAVYRALRSVNPSPYMFLLDFPDMALVGSSPEVMVRLEDNIVEVRPIAGTRWRGATPDEDKALENELLADEKERAEHTMLVDLGRNDIGRVCTFGSVHVPELMVIERYSHVMHIVSDVRGNLLPDKDAFDVLGATFPAGTVSGAPKIRAMEIIDEIEPVRRGPYAGAVCYLGYDGTLDSCITIRTIVMKNDVAYIQAGAGIVADSKPELEYKETVNKARAMVKAITLAEEIAGHNSV